MKQFNKILYTILLNVISVNVFAEEFNNHYMNHMYNNYIKGIPETKEFEITVYNTTPPVHTEINNYNKNQNTINTSNNNSKNKDFYIGLGIGIDFFQKYKTFTKMNPNQIAIMERKDYDTSINMLIGYKVPNQNINLEFEYLTTNNSDSTTTDINEMHLISYHQKFSINQKGINGLYKLDPLKSYNITPILKCGIGFAKFSINDFGLVWAKDGSPVAKGTAGAVPTEYESDKEDQTVNYFKLGVGASYTIYKGTEITFGLDYTLYNNIKLTNLKVEELSNINTGLNIKYSF